MSKHTPGPWRVVQDPTHLSLQVYGQTLALFECWRRSDEQIELANARLVAAAPDLLEALEFVIRGVPDTWEGVQKARAAIAKATGGEG
jgi:hypothetical protein